MPARRCSNDDRVAPATRARLATRFDRKQLLDGLITVGGYRMVSMSLNTFGVAAEPNRAAAYWHQMSFEISPSNTSGSSTADIVDVPRRLANARIANALHSPSIT